MTIHWKQQVICMLHHHDFRIKLERIILNTDSFHSKMLSVALYEAQASFMVESSAGFAWEGPIFKPLKEIINWR